MRGRAVVRTGGYPAGRTSMELPLATAIAEALSEPPRPIVRLPTIGGSAPFYLFSGRPQRADHRAVDRQLRQQPARANENLRIKNLWEGIESMAALLTMSEKMDVTLRRVHENRHGDTENRV
jgi:hypothetical protein